MHLDFIWSALKMFLWESDDCCCDAVRLSLEARQEDAEESSQ